MAARNLKIKFRISEGRWVRRVSSPLSLRIAYHGVGVPGGVVMKWSRFDQRNYKDCYPRRSTCCIDLMTSGLARIEANSSTIRRYISVTLSHICT